MLSLTTTAMATKMLACPLMLEFNIRREEPKHTWRRPVLIVRRRISAATSNALVDVASLLESRIPAKMCNIRREDGHD
ncbi:hypothetical protein ACET3X_009746 [Alternaria dauci]|uniref:Uncharacterized protein n=1 Tax=Alternaria dauci TaxID=48095 RepID=A0ABR3U6Q3_9PLEO